MEWVAIPASGGVTSHGKKTAYLTHACEVVDDQVTRVLCGRIKPEHILDDLSMHDKSPVDCPVCIKRMKAKRAKNPRSSLEKARTLYRNFREREPSKTKRVSIAPHPRAVMVMGRVSALEYETTHGDTAQGYRHKFAAGSRPLLCTDGKRLFIIGGRFRVTSRGIVDLNHQRREIE